MNKTLFTIRDTSVQNVFDKELTLFSNQIDSSSNLVSCLLNQSI